ncbi:MAG: hypothetical protein K5651_02040 [Bacteroidales bacterium]|nr:hypothetical protein [Bacteroidales bacterium]
MKKIIPLLAVALALPFMFSCKKDNGNSDAGTIPTGQNFSNARTLTINDESALNGSSISFNGDVDYVALTPETTSMESAFGGTKDKIRNYMVMIGTYTYSDNVYLLKDSKGKDWAKLTIKADNKVALEFLGEDKPFPGEKEFTVTSSKPDAGNETQRISNHTWKVKSSDVSYGALVKNQNGLDLNAYETEARAVLDPDGKWDKDPFFKQGMSLKSLIVTNEFVSLFFENGDNITCKVNLKEGSTFDIAPMDGKTWEFINGKAQIVFMGNTMIFTAKGEIKNNKGTLTVRLGL